jgi:outer membrane protein OmpA-like peptidoglycan-associated protein
MKKLFCLLILLSPKIISAQQKLEIYFDFNKFELNVDAKSKLDSLLIDNKNIEIVRVEGFCDSIDSNKYNKILSGKRAESVLNFFKNNNIQIINDVKTIGFGENFKQSENQSKNRKAIVFFNSKEENLVLKDKINKAKAGDLIRLKNINFYNNLDQILPKSKPVLEELLAIMKSNSNLKIEIQGHICCKRPNQEDTVSLARAKAIYNYLVDNNISKNRLKYKGYGVSKPIYKIPEKNNLEEDENRRVEILIVEK